mgnify:FL=1
MASLFLGKMPYCLVPFADFTTCIMRLAGLGALEIKPSYLKEWIESNTLESELENLTETFLLHNNVYMRFRRTSEIYGDDAVHGLTILGRKDAVIETARQIGLPHPFDKNLYPYTSLFQLIDERAPCETKESVDSNSKTSASVIYHQ